MLPSRAEGTPGVDAPHVWVLEDGPVFVCLTERKRRRGKKGATQINETERNNGMDVRKIVDGFLMK